MKIELTQEQYELLTEILHEYRDGCYKGMFEYQRAAVDAQDEAIKREYSAIAKSEETRFNDTAKLADYIERYVSLMRGD